MARRNPPILLDTAAGAPVTPLRPSLYMQFERTLSGRARACNVNAVRGVLTYRGRLEGCPAAEFSEEKKAEVMKKIFCLARVVTAERGAVS